MKFTFWERQNHRDENEISDCQGVEVGRGLTTKSLKELLGVMEIATLGKAFQVVLDEKSFNIQIGVPYWTCTPSSLLSVFSSSSLVFQSLIIMCLSFDFFGFILFDVCSFLTFHQIWGIFQPLFLGIFF